MNLTIKCMRQKNYRVMKYLKKYLKPISSFMAFIVLFFSCEQYEDSISTNEENKITGEELFKSIYFGLGPSLDNISVLERQREFISKMENSQKQIFSENTDQLIRTIRKDFPLFFDSFKEEIISGEHHIIESSLAEGAKMLRISMSQLVPNFENILSEIKKDVLDHKMDNNKKNVYGFDMKSTNHFWMIICFQIQEIWSAQ